MAPLDASVFAISAPTQVRHERRSWRASQIALRRSDANGSHVLRIPTTAAAHGDCVEWPCCDLVVDTKDWLGPKPTVSIRLRSTDATREIGCATLTIGASPADGVAGDSISAGAAAQRFLEALSEAGKDARRKRPGTAATPATKPVVDAPPSKR
eukprot:CAMPEP_0185511388 /NCGR_PEP_ID=MMETSP1366-20130426/51588_1 /TAXON_ID=38817 /ORGANISM="Gephyrocapsa oceanica, Strain RCC1303" /LENGTH=153 /DNA_ID=CAMNT_0028121949 /DNA_START=121 /DNA_END=579 /DNA_ORIENTATION=-